MIVVGGPDLESCQVGQNGDEGLRVESGHPLGLLPLVQPVPKGLGLYGGLVISLHKDGGGEPLSGSLENDVNDRGPGVVFPYSQIKGQKLVVAESLVTQVTSWKSIKGFNYSILSLSYTSLVSYFSSSISNQAVFITHCDSTLKAFLFKILTNNKIILYTN